MPSRDAEWVVGVIAEAVLALRVQIRVTGLAATAAATSTWVRIDAGRHGMVAAIG